jgi:hypothetical protein
VIRLPFADGWTVGPKLGAFETPAPGQEPKPVTLPHDALRDLPRSPDSAQGVHAAYYPGGVFEYVKSFEVPAEWRGNAVRVEFEGVYRDAAVFLNGEFVTHRPNGYTGFIVDADPYLRFGETNRISVEARVHKDSRWYTGAGIYRPVHLVVADPVHIPLDGVRVTTPDIDAERAVVVVDTTVRNQTRHTCETRVRWSIADASGSEVASGTSPVTVLPGEPATTRVRLAVPRPALWSTDAPHLYTLITTLTSGDVDIDSDTTTFGIRSLQLDTRHGLRINGETVKLRGACVHHDNGPIGAATIAAAEDRRIRLLKDAGFNAIRSAHNPLSRAMLDACDRHGVIVMDELTDVWTESKTAFDYSLAFPDWWREDAAALVAKDRNHPSVVLYSIGNEILELASPIGAAWSRRLANELRALDDTRFITNGINGIIANLDRISEAQAELAATDPNTMMAEMGEQMALMNASELVSRSIEESASVLDVVGFNYGDSRYEMDAAAHPNRVIVGSETFPARIDALWEKVERFPHVIGDFTWTGWDYIGEAGIGRVDYTDEPGYEPTGTAGPYPYLLAECGDIDITGHRRTISYWRETVFGLRSDPWIAVHRPQHHGRPTARTPWSWDDSVASWSWDAAAGSPVTVDVYADADEVELLMDGRSVGAAPVGVVKGCLARFETEYRPGELTAVARRDGAEVGRHTLRTAEQAHLTVRAEGDEIGTDAESLAFVRIALEDSAGIVPCDRDVVVTVEVDGPGVLAGLGTGRARTEEGFAGPAVTTYDGRALAVIRPTAHGPITLRVTADGLGEASVVVTAV